MATNGFNIIEMKTEGVWVIEMTIGGVRVN